MTPKQLRIAREAGIRSLKDLECFTIFALNEGKVISEVNPDGEYRSHIGRLMDGNATKPDGMMLLKFGKEVNANTGIKPRQVLLTPKGRKLAKTLKII